MWSLSSQHSNIIYIILIAAGQDWAVLVYFWNTEKVTGQKEKIKRSLWIKKNLKMKASCWGIDYTVYK